MLAHGFELRQALSLLAVLLGIWLGVMTLLHVVARPKMHASATDRRFSRGACVVTTTCGGVAYVGAFESPEDAGVLLVLGTMILALAIVAFTRA